MADTKISALTELTTGVADSDEFAINDGGTSKKITRDNLLDSVTVQHYIPAKAWERGLTNVPGSITQIEFGAENLTIPVIKFPASHQSEVFFPMVFPENWDLGTIKYKVYWTNDAGATTEVVSWKMSGFAYADSDILGAALTETEIEVTDTWLAQNDLHISSQSAAVTIIGTPAAGELCVLKFQRDVDDASDTLTGDAIFIGLELEYTITKTASAG